MPKTNASRLLEQLGIPHTLRDYDVDLDDLGAEAVARKVGLPIEQVWKTLLCRGDDRELGFAVLAGDATLDLKAYARLAGCKSAELVPLREVQPLTGYVRGGVTAIGGRKPLPVCVDELVELYDVVSVSAGVRGTQILLSPADFLRATAAKVGAIARLGAGSGA